MSEHTEKLQNEVDTLTTRLYALENEQRSIPTKIAAAVEAFNREQIAALRQRAELLADDLFSVRSDLAHKQIELFDAEIEDAANELATLNAEIDKLGVELRTIEAKRGPLQQQANQLRDLIKSNREDARKTKRQLDDTVFAEKQRLQAAAALMVAPTVQALNVRLPSFV